MNLTGKVLTWLLVAMAFLPGATAAQQGPAPLKPEELDQLVAPIALHPDKLLAQILMASTYPMEIVLAARFVNENPNVKGEQLNEALKQQTWDDSVKSLVFFPQVLTMLNDKLDWLQKLGDAFLAQQQDLMASIQRLRARAQAAGQLKSTPEQKVIVENAAASAQAPAPPAGAPPAAPPTVQQLPAAPPAQVVQVPPAQTTVQVQQAPPTVIKIEQANPQVVYVPSYDPTVVYGAFPPAYPPYYPYPPGYFMAGAFTFAAGAAVGAALWGDCDWNSGGGDVSINNSNANNFTNNVNNRDQARNRVEHRQAGAGDRGQGRGQWQHNPEHRKGAQYRDRATQQRFNRTGPANAQARESFRGRAEQGGAFGQAGARPSQGTLGQQGGLGQGGRGQQGGLGQQPAIGQQPAGGLGDRGGPSRAGGFDQGCVVGRLHGCGRLKRCLSGD